jgi:hypothetical protein
MSDFVTATCELRKHYSASADGPRSKSSKSSRPAVRRLRRQRAVCGLRPTRSSPPSMLGCVRRLDAAIFRAFVRWLGTEPVTVRIDLDVAEER